MAAVVSFLLMDVLGTFLWQDYNPTFDYVSILMANESPVVGLTKTLLTVYSICLMLYALAMTVRCYIRHRSFLIMGYTIIFLISIASLLGYGTVPISVNLIFAANDIFHIVLTIILLLATFCSLLFLSLGYSRQEYIKPLARLNTIITAAFVLTNICHVVAILSAYPVLGLIQRLTIYSFHVLVFTTSFIHVFNRDK